ncbi:MAG: NTP transferase domain-containing protein [Deltaproteobacteria bacterium]|jgi:NDP-sugar pyrophosphorylase family protein|nr:NTP transferase domain-containing protein [Deltaproteobacteria bacterium]
MPIAILAGGLGTRLGALCHDTPKALIEVAGAPFIHHQLRLLKKNDFSEVVILAGYLGELIANSLGDGSAFGLKISYSFDWPVLLGTGGSLVKALPLLSDNFMIIYGDSYLDIDYKAVSQAFYDSKKKALMTIFFNDNNYDKSNVLFTNNMLELYDKKYPTPNMKHVDYGLGVVSSSIFSGLSGNFDLADIYSKLSREGQLAGFLVRERFYEIGSLSGLAELESFLSQNF